MTELRRPPLSSGRARGGAAALALALLAGCAAAPEARKAPAGEATPYVREGEAKPPAAETPAPYAVEPPAAEAMAPPPYVPDGGGAAFAALFEEDDGRRVALAVTAVAAVALARAEAGSLVNPGAADLEALAPVRLGEAALGEPRAVTSGALAERRQATIADLRAEAARLGASWLIVARYEGKGSAKRLLASLHETSTGREVARYGPSEPSLPAAAIAFRQRQGRSP